MVQMVWGIFYLGDSCVVVHGGAEVLEYIKQQQRRLRRGLTIASRQSGLQAHMIDASTALCIVQLTSRLQTFELAVLSVHMAYSRHAVACMLSTIWVQS